MGFILDGIGRHIARYLDRPIKGYHPFAPSDPDVLRALLRPCDVLLVEGNNHIAGVIKYLTQSTWSHAALYVGPIGERTTEDGEPLVLVEANVGEGVVGAPLSKYLGHHTRICRPISLSPDDAYRVCAYATERIGFDYDVKNITDLLRYLFPVPMPQRWRRRLMALGSGEPTRIICSALIAQAEIRRGRAAGTHGDPSRFALRAARFRHLALLPDREADARTRFRLSQGPLGGLAGSPGGLSSCACRGDRAGYAGRKPVGQLHQAARPLLSLAEAECSTPRPERLSKCSRRRSGA
jgi:hypothetical protein